MARAAVGARTSAAEWLAFAADTATAPAGQGNLSVANQINS